MISYLVIINAVFTLEATKYLEQHLTAEKGSRFLETVRKLKKELGDKKTKLDTAKAKRIVESLDDGMSVDDVVAELKQWCESGSNSANDIFIAGKKAFDNFDINNAYVKPKHLSTTGGNGQKFIGASKAEAESILKDVLSNGNIVSITDNGLTKAGNTSYEIIIDAGKTVGTKGETLVKIVISSDGGMLSAYPIK